VSGQPSEELVRGWLAARPESTEGELGERLRQIHPLLNTNKVSSLVGRALDRAHGLGPLAQFLERPEVTEVMVNGPGNVWLDCNGALVETAVVLDADEIQVITERILDPLGLRVDRTSPMVDARLPDGSRVNVVLPPLAVDGPILTIRRFATGTLPLSDFGPPPLVSLLEALVTAHVTVLVIGATGAGKTTLLNAMGQHLAPTERVVTIEDTAELRLTGRHVVRLEARPANSEGVGEVTIRDLVRNALRMRPDRLIVGEVRGGEALDLLLALNTGHSGSMATCHANSPEAALHRVRTLALLGGVELPVSALTPQVVGGFDVVVQVAKVGARRRVKRVVEVQNNDQLVTEEIWPTPQTGGNRVSVRRAMDSL
jgi:pilus assembly protein CpaF